MKTKSFEIVYADGIVEDGETEQHFRELRNDDIIFVIVEFEDGTIVKYKGQDEYVYRGATKPGSWTSDENYQALKDRLHEISDLLAHPEPGPTSRLVREIVRQLRK